MPETDLLKDIDVLTALHHLWYDEAPRAESLLATLSSFINGYVAVKEAKSTTPCYIDEHDVATQWLDRESNGLLFWPSLPLGQHSARLIYAYDRELIVNEVESLVCAICRAGQRTAGEPAKCVVRPIQQNMSLKKYTAIAQAALISCRKGLILSIRPAMSDTDIYKTLTALLDNANGTAENVSSSFDALSAKFRHQLTEDRVVALPTAFFPLQQHRSRVKQDGIATQSLNCLKSSGTGIPVEIGISGEERLQSAAKLCGDLSYKYGFQLPLQLNDDALPDLLSKLTIMELGRVTGVSRR